METIIESLYEYKSGNRNAGYKILKKMEPLIKKYAKQIHFMEYEDAQQELYMAVIKGINRIEITLSEGECVKYIESCVVNCYKRLCKSYFSKVKEEEIIVKKISSAQSDDVLYEDILFNEVWRKYSENMNDKTKKRIMDLHISEGKKGTEIAEELGISRQYVNRIVKDENMRFYHYLKGESFETEE